MGALSEFTSAIMWAQDMEQARGAFRTGLAAAGVGLYAYVNFQSVGDAGEPFIDSTYPAAWMARYRDRGYLDIDPVAQEFSRNALPFAWRYVTNRGGLSPEQRAFFDEASHYGLADGYAIPFHGNDGCHAGLSLAFDSTERMKSVLTAQPNLRSLAIYYHAAVERLLEEALPEDMLTKVERQCLECASQGRSLWEISAATHRSEGEVAAAIRAARHKLGVTSTAQAAEKAASLGLIAALC